MLKYIADIITFDTEIACAEKLDVEKIIVDFANQ